MLCKEIMKVIEASYPTEAALDFDNVGLLAGRAEKEVERVYLALDATDAVIGRAAEAGADMLITHHPLIFTPLKKVNDQDFVSKRVLRLIQNDISYYAMHTNYDVLRMAELSEKILKITDAEVLDETLENADGKKEGIGRVGMLEKPVTLEECCVYVKHKLNLGSIKVFGDMGRMVRRMAVSPGSGKSAISAALRKGADVLVTGDIGHHDGIDAVEQGLCIIDAGHYGTEYIFLEDMQRFLNEKLPGLEVTSEPVIHPFQVV
ncbi:MAG TPA: Nif3-like dinuclear metal center hexameric protein [Candidatus Mediterraneibacter intestinavium]|nr:Nif3-like dinuclear metal center hexameric protein [Candidatus Mediterraneibacter intestinavium]